MMEQQKNIEILSGIGWTFTRKKNNNKKKWSCLYVYVTLFINVYLIFTLIINDYNIHNYHYIHTYFFHLKGFYTNCPYSSGALKRCPIVKVVPWVTQVRIFFLISEMLRGVHCYLGWIFVTWGLFTDFFLFTLFFCLHFFLFTYYLFTYYLFLSGLCIVARLSDTDWDNV